MSHPRRHRWFRRTALGLALAAVMVVTGNALGYDDQGFNAAKGARAEADARADDKQIRIELAFEAQGDLSGYVIEVADEVVASGGSLHDPSTAALTEADAKTDDKVIALEPWTAGTGLGCELRGEC